jgi:hypothetical protein
MFVLPSIIFAFAASIPALYFIYKKLISADMQQLVFPFPSYYACMIGIFLGLGIPAISSIIPIKNALSKTLGDSLNMDRQKTSGIVIKVNDGKVNVIPYLLFGLITVTYGVCVFFLLPYSLLTLNLSLVLGIFFAILIAMLFGLTLISYNL